MTFIKTSILTAISTAIKMACSFLIIKVLAVFLGPPGLAMVGQFQNFMQASQTFSGGVLGHGIVKYVAEYKNNEEKKTKILSAVFAISLISSVFISVFLFTFRHSLTEKIFQDQRYSIVMTLFAVTFIFYVMNNLLSEIMNGEMDIKRLTFCNIISSVVSLLLTLLLVVKYHVLGGLFMLVFTPTIVFFISMLFVLQSQWFKVRLFLGSLEKIWAIRLFKYALMTLTSVLLAPAVQLVLRGYIIRTFSWQDAGYWDAINKISDGYLFLITSIFAVYYFPKLSQISILKDMKKEVIYGYKTILPVAILFAVLIFIFKEKVVFLLFSPHFLPMMMLFKYQLIGDVFKIGSWLISYIMLAKAMTRLFIFTEVIFNCLYILLAVILTHYNGLVGVTMAFFSTYGIYWIFMGFYLLPYLKENY